MNPMLALSAVAVLGLAACSTMNAPVSSEGGFDPLAPAGTVTTRSSETQVGSAFTAGQFVHTAMDNTAFFSKRPRGSADADKLLKKGVQMKVVNSDSSYVKVELDSGEVGFVPTVLVSDPSQPVPGSVGTPGEFDVIPAIPGADPNTPLPIIDPAGLPPADAIPTVIDPEAPPVIPETPPTTAPSGAPLTPLSGIAPPAPAPAPAPVPASETPKPASETPAAE